MRRRNNQSSPFLHRVFLPGLRSTLLALGVLAIGFGSWLETNDAIDNCSVRSNLVLHKVSLLRNLTSDAISPDGVTFGLWKHCFIYALNCTCTPARLTYAPDAPTVLEAAIGNDTAIPTTHDISYWRVIPFALATALGGIAFIFGVVANRLENRKLQWCNAGLVSLTLILFAIGFGYSYHQYTFNITKACDQLGNHCTAIHHGIEFIVLIIGIVLLGLSLILWAYAPPHSLLQEQQDDFSTTPQQQQNKENRLTHTSDALDPWRDVQLFDEKSRASDTYRPIHDHHYDEYHHTQQRRPSDHHHMGGPLPPPPSNSNRYRRRQSNDLNMEEDRVLQPPSRPFATSPRRASHGSGNTFGANNMLRNSRGSSVMLENDEYYYSSASSDGNHSPTHTSYRRSSSAMSPTYPNSPSSSNNKRRSQSPYSRPGTAPPTTTHPLNRKVITDQRIGAYLSQQQ